MAAATTSKSDNLPNQQSREQSVSDFLDYTISFAEDKTLQWDPPAGSPELAIALSYHFPMEKGVGGKMRAATKKFLRGNMKDITKRGKADDSRSPKETVKQSPSDTVTSSPGHGKVAPREGDHEDSNNGLDTKRVDNISYADAVKSSTSQNLPHNSNPLNSKQRIAHPTRSEDSFVHWNPKIEGFRKKGMKRAYAKDESAKVTANRGFVCDEHRRQKKKVPC